MVPSTTEPPPTPPQKKHKKLWEICLHSADIAILSRWKESSFFPLLPGVFRALPLSTFLWWKCSSLSSSDCSLPVSAGLYFKNASVLFSLNACEPVLNRMSSAQLLNAVGTQPSLASITSHGFFYHECPPLEGKLLQGWVSPLPPWSTTQRFKVDEEGIFSDDETNKCI